MAENKKIEQDLKEIDITGGTINVTKSCDFTSKTIEVKGNQMICAIFAVNGASQITLSTTHPLQVGNLISSGTGLIIYGNNIEVSESFELRNKDVH